MAGIRWILGSLILFLNWVFSPKSIVRNSVLQKEIDQQFSGFTLFHYPACPFCVKVRRVMKKYNLSLKLVDPRNCETGMQDLIKGGGKLKVPCLRIQNNNEGAIRSRRLLPPARSRRRPAARRAPASAPATAAPRRRSTRTPPCSRAWTDSGS